MKICTSYCFALVIFNKYLKIHYGDGDENVTSNVTLHNPNFFAIISSRSLILKIEFILAISEYAHFVTHVVTQIW